MNPKYEDNINVDYLNGYLRCLSETCAGCNFVPLYGAISFPINDTDTLSSLKLFLDIRKYSANHHREISNYCILGKNDCRAKLDALLETWVDQKAFQLNSKQRPAGVRDFIRTCRSDIIEQIEIISGSDPECFYANLQHDAFEYDCEIIGFVGNGNAFFIHFSFSD